MKLPRWRLKLPRWRRRRRGDPGCLTQLLVLASMFYVWRQARRWDRRHRDRDASHDP